MQNVEQISCKKTANLYFVYCVRWVILVLGGTRGLHSEEHRDCVILW